MVEQASINLKEVIIGVNECMQKIIFSIILLLFVGAFCFLLYDYKYRVIGDKDVIAANCLKHSYQEPVGKKDVIRITQECGSVIEGDEIYRYKSRKGCVEEIAVTAEGGCDTVGLTTPGEGTFFAQCVEK